MKILNEKGKLFGLINIIDLGVLLIILALVAGGLWYLRRETPSVTVETKDYLITLRSAGFSEDVAKAINTGDRLYYGKGFINAEVTEVRAVPARVDVHTADGKIVVQDHPELKDIFVTIKIADPVDDPMIWIGQLHATVGKEMVLKTSRVEIPAQIISIVE